MSSVRYVGVPAFIPCFKSGGRNLASRDATSFIRSQKREALGTSEHVAKDGKMFWRKSFSVIVVLSKGQEALVPLTQQTSRSFISLIKTLISLIFFLHDLNIWVITKHPRWKTVSLLCAIIWKPLLLFKFSFLPMALAFSLSLSVYNPTKAFCGGTWRKHTQGDNFFFFFLNLSVVRNFSRFKVWQTDRLNIITMTVQRTHAKTVVV